MISYFAAGAPKEDATLAKEEFLADLGEVGNRFQIHALGAALELDSFLDGHGIAAINNGPGRNLANRARGVDEHYLF